MMDFTRVDERIVALIVTVVDELARLGGVTRNRLMIVGAEARNLLHVAQGHDFALRTTADLDVAVLMNDWPAFEQLEDRAEHTGDTGIRFLIAGVAVDVMPFGEVEEPQGTVVPRRRGEPLDVFGFTEVFADGLPLAVGGLDEVRIPTPAGFAALKLKAWIDRSPHFQYKDAGDIATSMYWYQESPGIHERLYATERGQELLITAGLDQDIAATVVLGADIRALLGGPLSDALVTMIEPTRDLLAKELQRGDFPVRRREPARASQLVSALVSGLAARTLAH